MLLGGITAGLLATATAEVILSFVGLHRREYIGLLTIAFACGFGAGIVLAPQDAIRSERKNGPLWLIGLPMATVSIVLFAIGREIEDPIWQALTLNLSTTAIGVIVTVFLVDRIIRQHERETWARADRAVLRLLRDIVGDIPGTMAVWGIVPNYVSSIYVDKDDRGPPRTLDERVFPYARKEVANVIRQGLAGFEQEKLLRFFDQMERWEQDLERFLDLHRDRLPPSLYGATLELIPLTHSVQGLMVFMDPNDYSATQDPFRDPDWETGARIMAWGDLLGSSLEVLYEIHEYDID